MTFEEFNSRMDQYSEQIKNCSDWKEKEKLLDEVGEFQYTYMEQVRDDCDDVRIYGILDYLITRSQTGNVIDYTYFESDAEELADLLCEKCGDYLLEAPEIYPTTDERFAIDIMFGGYYTPYWDGWED